MAMPLLNIKESPLNFDKFKLNPKKSNPKSLWAFLLSIFIYISVFYIFNLSPSTLLYTTKFWFIILNTLILIIAADFGAFRSSNEYDFYEEYIKNNAKAKSTYPSYQTPYKKTSQKDTLTSCKSEQLEEKPREKIIEMVVTNDDNKSRQKVVVVKENPNEKIEKRKPKMARMDIENEAFEAKCVRSNSDKAILVNAAKTREIKQHGLQRTTSERYDHEEPKLEENEFSSMSNEELNKRVEDFIRKFNRQIRLQADRNRQ